MRYLPRLKRKIFLKSNSALSIIGIQKDSDRFVSILIISISSLKTIEPLISFINDEKQKIFWLGQCDRNLGEMKQFQSLELLLNLYPTKLGLHSIPSIKILDQLTNECFEFRELASINVI